MRVSALLCIRQAAAFGGSPGLRIACDVDATDQRVGALVNRITKDRFIEIGELTAMAHTIVVQPYGGRKYRKGKERKEAKDASLSYS